MLDRREKRERERKNGWGQEEVIAGDHDVAGLRPLDLAWLDCRRNVFALGLGRV